MMELIVVKYNSPDYERECVQSIVEVTKRPHHLTIYDNYPLNENLSVVWNRLIGRSNADIIVLVNNDTILEEGWEQMLDILEDEKIGAVGPITNRCGTHQNGFDKVDKIDEVLPCATLSGFFVAFRKDVWEKVKFNEEYKLYGEDSEWCEEVKRLGYQLLTDYRVHIFHHKGVSGKHRTDLEEVKKEAGKRFREYKHGS
jgi:GT2 family glycosyltransferase